MIRFGIIAIHLTLLTFLTVGFSFASQSKPSSDINKTAKDQSSTQIAPKAFFPVLNHNFGSVLDGAEVKYDFVLENQGDAPLVIKNIRPD